MNEDQDQTLETLGTLFREFFMDDTIRLDRATTTHDIAGWDSLTNISLMLAVQRAFGVKFSARDQDGLHNVGDLAALVHSKRGVSAPA